MKYNMKLLLFALLSLLALAAANHDQCATCQQFFIVTGQNLYRIEGDLTQTLCASGFEDARGVTVDQNGNVFVADAGARAIYFVDANCTSNQTLVIQNDGINHSWLYPYDITIDDQNNLYITMFHYDEQWTVYDNAIRQRLARESHVYRIGLDDQQNFSGDVSILAGGVKNGRNIDHVRWTADDGLWGTRDGKYVVRFRDGLWEDWLGPNNIFRANKTIQAVKQVDPSITRCGFLALAVQIDNQVAACNFSSDNNDPQCQFLLQCDNSNSSDDNDSNDSRLTVVDCLSYDCLDDFLTTFNFSDNSGSSGNSGSTICDNLNTPYSVVLDCECNLLVSSLGNQQLLKYPHPNNVTQTQIPNLLYTPSQVVLTLSEPIYGMINYIPSNCTSSSSSNQ